MPDSKRPSPPTSATATPLLLLGIDGGGTQTSAVLACRDSDGTISTLGCGTSGPSNPRSAGWPTAQQNVEGAVAAAFGAAGRARQRVAGLCLAAAGAGHPAARAQWRQWCDAQGLATIVHVVHDAEIVLRAGTPQGTGIALIAGTGSLAYGRTAEGRTARAGGWGYLLGDEGSGYAIGLSALRAVARATDGRGPATQLVPRLLQQCGVTDPWDLIPAVYEDHEPRRRIVALAPHVLAVAEDADAVAQEIRQRAACDLAALVTAVARALGDRAQGYHLALSGGLLRHQGPLRADVLQRLAAEDCVPQSSAVVEDPVQGAVLLASDLCARETRGGD